MNDLRLTDAQFSAGTDGHRARRRPWPDLRVEILADVETMAQERPLPGLLGRARRTPTRTRAGGRCFWRPLRCSHLGLATAGVAGALLQEREAPLPCVDLTPPTDLPAFARSAYESMPKLPPLTLTALRGRNDQAPDLRGWLGGRADRDVRVTRRNRAGRLRDLRDRNTRAQLVTVGSERRWIQDPAGAIGEDPRVFVYANLGAPGHGQAPVPGCEVATSPGEEYVGEPGRAWQYVGVETVVGRAAHHISCGGRDRWLDIETRLTLRDQTSAGISEVTEITFGQPPADLFDMRQPEGIASISGEEYYMLHEPRVPGNARARADASSRPGRR